MHAGQQVATRRRRALIVIQKGEMRFSRERNKAGGGESGRKPGEGEAGPASPFRNINLASVRRRRLLGRATSTESRRGLPALATRPHAA